jgi:uncharacterized RDD family membrane protein YckC
MAYAGVGIRFAAAFLDGILFFVLGLVVAFLSGGAYATHDEQGTSAGLVLEGGGFLAWLVLVFAYYVVTEAALGASIGKSLVGLRVVDEDGCAITWGQSIVRNLLRPIDFIVAYLIAAICVWASPRRQRLGDLVASTFVVRV